MIAGVQSGRISVHEARPTSATSCSPMAESVRVNTHVESAGCAGTVSPLIQVAIRACESEQLWQLALTALALRLLADGRAELHIVGIFEI